VYSKILVALDGSEWSAYGAGIALELAHRLGTELVAAHVYDSGIHSLRFREMERVLPRRYQKEEKLQDLRDSHGRLMYEGFESMSRGYMEDFVAEARAKGAGVEAVQREGRNYLTLLGLAHEYQVQLIVLGAFGLGKVPEAVLGSTALRVLRQADCDVLIARRPLAGRRLLVGIDGSGEAAAALRRAAAWARILNKDLELAAVYDPFFHDEVFKTMASSFSPERQEEVGLAKQEELHEQIIDDGLGQLYAAFLEQAEQQVREPGIEVTTTLLQGKAYRTLSEQAGSTDVDLVVVGRFGQHREEASLLGSNSEALVRQCGANVLVTRAASATGGKSVQTENPLDWDQNALELLERVPEFARPMARGGVEAGVRSRGAARVTRADFLDLARRMGMPIPKDKK
jgi:nucleotide-binding universal stress UspA family protein